MSRTVYNRSALRVKLAEWAKKNGGRCIVQGSYDNMTKLWSGAVYSFETSFGVWTLSLPNDNTHGIVFIRSNFTNIVPTFANQKTGAWDFESTEESSLFRVFTDAAEKMLKGEAP